LQSLFGPFNKIHSIYYDDAENVTSKPHGLLALETTPAQQTKKDLAESTGVMSAKYPPKVKSELFLQF